MHFNDVKSFQRKARKHSAITQNVLEFTVLDAQAMSVVEEEGLRHLLEYLEPRYSLPSRKYFSETGIQFIVNSTTVWDRQIHKAQASVSVSGLKKLDRCIPISDSGSLPLLFLTMQILPVTCHVETNPQRIRTDRFIGRDLNMFFPSSETI